MSKPKMFEKPVGVKDYLPHAVAKLRRIERNVLDCMRRWGYEQIITPTLEYYDTVGVASATSDRKLFKLLDHRGTTIVLRSDMTAPIARVVASLLKQAPFPLRLSYHANVFRAFEEEAGRDAEFFQTGVELVGDASAEADAEVIALAIASLEAAGVSSFHIAFGHVGFLNGLFEEKLPGWTEAQELLKECLLQRVKECLLQRDFVGYREQLRALGLAERDREALESILRLRGGRETCDRALALSAHDGARDAIRQLSDIWDVLGAYGVQDRVLIDLTMIGDFSYYTGMTFEGYASRLGFPVCSGGRYDNLLAQFGRPAPATGFALKTTRILEVVEEAEEAHDRLLILYAPGACREALAEAAAQRGDGRVVVTAPLRTEADWAEAEALAGRNAAGPFTYRGRTFERLHIIGRREVDGR
jgi:ATP phosphoribosyltransferase regulatory subunit